MECGVGKRHTVSSWELSSAYPICPGQSESDPLSLWAHNSTLNSSSWGPIPWIFLELLWKSHVFSWVAERRSWKSSGDLLAMWPISKEPGSENSCLSEEKSDTEGWRRTKFWYCWSSLWMQSSLTSELCSCISQWSPFPSFLPLQAYTIYLSVCLSVYLSAHLSISHLYRYLPLYCSFFAYLFRFLLLNLLELGSVPMSKYDHAILFFFQRDSYETYTPQSNLGTVVLAHSPPHTSRNFFSLIFTWKPEVAVQSSRPLNETQIFCWKYTPPMSLVFMNLCINYVLGQGNDSEKHTVLVIIEHSLEREKQTTHEHISR